VPAGSPAQRPPRYSARASNRRGDGQRLRAEIIEAAMRLLATVPAPALSLRAIAREARISAPAIYLQFDSRDEIIFELVCTAWRELAEAMGRADDEAADSGPLAQLYAQVHAYLKFALASPTRYELLFTLQPDPAITERMLTDQPVSPVYRVLEHAVKRCAEAGIGMRVDDIYNMTVLIFVIAHGRVALSHAVPGQEFSRPEIIRSYVDAILGSIVYEIPEAPARDRPRPPRRVPAAVRAEQ
jgi:AcrR family transcriptional regulator